MRREPAKRIGTGSVQAPLGGLDGAFASVNMPGGLPPGPDPAPSAAAEPAAPHWKPGRVVLRRERAHRGGKTVIVIADFATHLPPSFIETVAREVRAACGCGGTVRERTVEIQGDQPAKVRAALEARGFQVAGVK